MMLDGLNAKGRCNMRFPCAGSTDQHHILGSIQELASMELADQSFTDLAGAEVEGGQVLVCREAGGFHVVGGRTHLTLGHFRLEKLRQDRHGGFKCG